MNMEHLWCSIIYMATAIATTGEAAPAPAALRHHHVAAGNITLPIATIVDAVEEDDEPTPTAIGPTSAGPSLPRSKPLITTETTSTFQIRRGRKPTLIIEVTRGESSSPVINKFNFIPLRSQPKAFSSREHLAINSLRPSSTTINHKPTVQPASHEPARCHCRCPRPHPPAPAASVRRRCHRLCRPCCPRCHRPCCPRCRRPLPSPPFVPLPPVVDAINGHDCTI
ncbi:hypothetical protein ACLOJK_006944 [Asimina triloba]